MWKAIIYKEWKKTKWFNIGIWMVAILLLTYIFMKIGRSFRFVGMEHLWDVVVNRDQFLFRNLKYFPIAAGIIFGLSQFVPEVIEKRIKLTLHLPLPKHRAILIMIAYGLILLTITFTIHILTTIVFVQLYFPKEIIISMIFTIVPWYISGLVAYSFIAMISLEPTWKRRIFNIILMVLTLDLFYISDFPGAYRFNIYLVILISIYVMPFVFLSVNRFKKGIQD